MVEILKLCREMGYLLDKEMLEYFSGMDEGVAEKVIDSFEKMGINRGLVTRSLFLSYSDKFGGVKVDNEGSVKLISSVSFSQRKIEVKDFINHFRYRYGVLKGILEERGFDNLSSLRKIDSNNIVCTIIAAVTDKRITKNKNMLFEVEDLTGNSVVLVNQDRREVFEKAKNLLVDDIVAFRVSGTGKMLFVSDIIYPDAGLEKERHGNVDEYVAFSGDFHTGSTMFLEKNLLKFIKWLNGGVGDDRQRAIAMKVKYLFLTGDNIDGVGIFADQDKWLNIKTSLGQYRKVEELLKLIRKDVEIIMCPGQHDSVWLGEPQPMISRKWAPGLYEMENLHLVTNPALVEIGGGFKVLMYHGASINRFINQMDDIRVESGHGNPTRVVKEMLKRRHLAPMHGVMDYIPCEEKDPLVIDVVPDIVATADQHRAEICSYNNILLVSSSCWQSMTPFEEKVGNVPDPCKVPLVNLKTREVKIVDFSGDDDVKWETGEDLICELSDCKVGVKDE